MTASPLRVEAAVTLSSLRSLISELLGADEDDDEVDREDDGDAQPDPVVDS
jgi:hypothetical protein